MAQSGRGRVECRQFRCGGRIAYVHRGVALASLALHGLRFWTGARILRHRLFQREPEGEKARSQTQADQGDEIISAKQHEKGEQNVTGFVGFGLHPTIGGDESRVETAVVSQDVV